MPGVGPLHGPDDQVQRGAHPSRPQARPVSSKPLSSNGENFGL